MKLAASRPDLLWYPEYAGISLNDQLSESCFRATCADYISKAIRLRFHSARKPEINSQIFPTQQEFGHV
jgi:hypothetical protein